MSFFRRHSILSTSHIMDLSEDNQRNLAVAEQLKDEGIRLFHEDNYKAALAKSAKVFLYVSGFLPSTSKLAKFGRGNVMSPETEARVRELKYSTLVHQAMCLIKMNESARAVTKCDLAIEIKRTAMILYYRGQALLQGGNVRKAKEDFLQGKALEPENSAFDDMLAKVAGETTDRKLAKGLKRMLV